MSRYLVTEKDGTGHLPVRDSDDGPLNHHLMGAAWAALHGGYRGNEYQGPNKEKAIAKLKALYKSEGMGLPTETSDFRLKIDDCRLKTRFAVVLAGPGRPIENHQSSIANLHKIPICVTGTWVKNSHMFCITAEDLTDMVRNFEKRKNDQVVIDYEHASEQPEVAKGGPIPAAGWIHALRVETGKSKMETGNLQDGPVSNFQFPVSLFASVEWTPEAARMIQGGQYRFFSPAIDWNFPDKETGKSQGATLTSGALTNHPFLEELPPITLTESGVVLADVSTAYLDAPLTNVGVGLALPKIEGTASRTPTGPVPDGSGAGGRMGSKKLSICKMDGSDKFDGTEFDGADGHHGIFDGKDYLGHIHKDDLKDHVKACMADGFGDLDGLKPKDGGGGDGDGQAGIKGHQTASELLREAGARSKEQETPADAVLRLLKVAQTHELVEQREASRNLILSECLPSPGGEGARGTRAGEGSFDTEKAKQLLRDKKIDAADLLDAIEAKGMIDDAVAKGKVLPKDRAFFFEIAFNSPKKFTDYIAGAVPVVSFTSVGIGSTENMPVDQEVDVEAKKLMSEKNIGYGKAMKEIFKANPQLEERYRAAHRVQPKDNTEVADRSADITQ